MKCPLRIAERVDQTPCGLCGEVLDCELKVGTGAHLTHKVVEAVLPGGLA